MLVETVGVVIFWVGFCITLLSLTLIVLGFGYKGVSSGSVASCIQSCIGDVEEGSCFAKLVSCGMTGSLFKTFIIGVLVSLLGFCIIYYEQGFDRDETINAIFGI